MSRLIGLLILIGFPYRSNQEDIGCPFLRLLVLPHEPGGIRAAGGGRPEPAFHYHHVGDLATIGHKSAVVNFGWVCLSGLSAWLFWGCVHIFFLISFRNHLVVMIGWLWSYFTSDRGARLITGTGREI